MGEETFGALLRAARQHALLSLEGLAEASGVSVRAISDMERGRSLPRQATLAELMDALELDGTRRRRLVQAATRRADQVPRQLPPDLVSFRGREEALRSALQATDQVAGRGGHVVISAIGGMAGVGKTALAVHWAHQVAERFPDGQLYVDLRGFEDSGAPLDPGEALGGFLRALGVPSSDIPPGTEQRTVLFRERTAARRLIVLLDNARDADQVRPLLPVSAGSLTVVTSRNRLAGLAATEGAALISLDVWSREEAVTALAARIGEERCRAEAEAAAELVALCGHLPLAVAVVGAQLGEAPAMPLALALRELRATSPRLDALSADGRSEGVRAVFSWSYRALSAGTARFFRHLALHPGPVVSAEAAASLAGTEPVQARRHLRELTAASLLSRDAEGRYVLHDLVRAYGCELAAREQDDRLAAETRLLDYLCHNAHTANRFVSRFPPGPAGSPAPGTVRVEFDDREEGLGWFRQEESTAAAALRSLEDPRLLRHRVGLTLEWVGYNAVMGRWAEEVSAARTGLEAALLLDEPVTVARSSAHLVRALVETGRLDEADEPIALMLGQLDRLPVEHQVRVQRNVSFIRTRQERYAEALGHARAALAVARTLPRPDEVARTLIGVGWCLALNGEYEEAISTCEEALPLLRESDDRGSEASVWDSVGYAQQRLGDPAAAVTSFEKALALLDEVHDEYQRAETLDHLASAQLDLGDTAGARANWLRAADLLTALRVPRAAELRARAGEL
ncbi:ATP-binding protein [Streptomyces sp. NRRL S-340]|uniref:ATP-binding protein n=1 Tax=Streptomyces sp. NRRL S-340 TaxID=1463901 RepID=UPI00056AD820|nr:helix-turn-helix transcriptional regulator [Streptomyces sp. NRRL S-340]